MGTVHAKEPTASNLGQYYEKEAKRSDVPMDDHSSSMEKSSGSSSRKSSQQTATINLQGSKARVDKIHIDGLKRTKDDFVKAQVTELFKAQDFQDVIVRAHKVRNKLEALGCFGNIGVYIDTSEGPNATPDGVEVTFTVKEMKRILGSVNTMVGNNEGSVLVEARAPNIFGRGEKLQMEYSYGTKNTINANISFVKPYVNSWLHTVLTSSVFATHHEYLWSGYKEKDIGFLIDAALNPRGLGTLKHNFQYEAAYREIIALKQASFRVREQCGPSLKSALRHICSIDKRDTTIFPTTGSLIQLTTEVAGLGGDIGFMKNELVLQSNWTPHEIITFQIGLQSGLLRGVSNDMKINIVDRFFLGGPLNLRGFEMRGCGPRHDGSSIGGDVYWAAAFHIYTPLPFRPGFGDLFKLHGFINAGNLYDFNFKFGNDYKKNMQILTNNIRCAAGGGIAMQIGNVARIELNMIMPLLFNRNDILQRFQFGIGVQYL